jgi:hypothetical protein
MDHLALYPWPAGCFDLLPKVTFFTIFVFFLSYAIGKGSCVRRARVWELASGQMPRLDVLALVIPLKIPSSFSSYNKGRTLPGGRYNMVCGSCKSCRGRLVLLRASSWFMCGPSFRHASRFKAKVYMHKRCRKAIGQLFFYIRSNWATLDDNVHYNRN